jgi:hypothetical protein
MPTPNTGLIKKRNLQAEHDFDLVAKGFIDHACLLGA